jgi:hypothetical protein
MSYLHVLSDLRSNFGLELYSAQVVRRHLEYVVKLTHVLIN